MREREILYTNKMVLGSAMIRAPVAFQVTKKKSFFKSDLMM